MMPGVIKGSRKCSAVQCWAYPIGSGGRPRGSAVEVTSQNLDGKLHSLDLCLCVDGENTIRHVFYAYPIASKLLIQQRSVVSYDSKRNTLFEEGQRRLWNCDLQTTTQESKRIMIVYSNQIRISGDNERTRRDILERVFSRSK